MIENRKIVSTKKKQNVSVGRDFAGRVVATGSAVRDLGVGDRVMGVVPPQERGAHADHLLTHRRYVGGFFVLNPCIFVYIYFLLMYRGIFLNIVYLYTYNFLYDINKESTCRYVGSFFLKSMCFLYIFIYFLQMYIHMYYIFLILCIHIFLRVYKANELNLWLFLALRWCVVLVRFFF